jgi:phosphopantetheinyl transferase
VENLQTGKPILVDSNVEISITHSFPLAGAMINLHKPCGIDLEWPREKLRKIQGKFLHESEKKHENNIDALCKIWLSKEVLFKVYGIKSLSFKDEMKVNLDSQWMASGRILKPGQTEQYPIRIEPVFNYFLAYSV